MVAAVECVEPHRIDRAGAPKPQRVDVAPAPSHDRRVIGNGLDGFLGRPYVSRRATGRVHGLDPSAEVNVVSDFRARELPRIAEGQPVFRIFLLPAVLDDLAEHPVIVTDAVAVGWDAEARHALHETGGEATEAAVAQRRIRLRRPKTVGIDAEIAERGAHDIAEAKIAEHVR